MTGGYHGEFLDLVQTLERTFPVSEWRCGDVEIWPIARMELYLDMYWAQAAGAPPAPRHHALQALARAATPARNLWKSRHDLQNWIIRPHRAHALFLGDGVSLDFVDQAWQDRFCEPLIAEFERCGRRTFLMQGGELARLPWHRPTFSVNQLGAWGALTAMRAPRVQLPHHEAVLRLLAERGVAAPSLQRARLEQRARVVHATAGAFERILRKVQPVLAFVVTYYAGLGAAFLVACRRQRVLSIDLQHCPQEGAHKAYGWRQVPASGYAALPAVFWTWTAHDAAYIRAWTEQLATPWHQSVHGGHTQWARLARGNMDSAEAQSKPGDAQFEREILVALQPLGLQRQLWRALRTQIEQSPRRWRWWLRRHPASTPQQDREYSDLLSLERPNVVSGAASAQALPTLLKGVHAVVSYSSGTAAEAAAFGVPALFLSEHARLQFAALIDRGQASIVDVIKLNEVIAHLPAPAVRPALWQAAPLAETLRQLTEMARDYAHR